MTCNLVRIRIQKIIPKRSNNSRSGGVLEASMGVLGRLGSIWAWFGEFRAVLMAFCGYLGPSGRRICVVLEASWRRLGGVLGRLGASWGVMWASLERLGGILCPICSPKGFNVGMLSLMRFFNWFLVGFASQNRSPNLEKSFNSIGKIANFWFQTIFT